MNIDIDELERLARAASPGPWSYSAHNPKSAGVDIWCGTAPVALVTEGPWGPVHASLRLEQEDPNGAVKVVPFLERITHGEVSGAQASANRSYIAAAHPAVVLGLITALRAAQAPQSWGSKLADLVGLSRRKEVKPPVLQIADQSKSAFNPQQTATNRDKPAVTPIAAPSTPSALSAGAPTAASTAPLSAASATTTPASVTAPPAAQQPVMASPGASPVTSGMQLPPGARPTAAPGDHAEITPVSLQSGETEAAPAAQPDTKPAIIQPSSTPSKGLAS